ncbi:MAG: MlaD family protein [Bacteroidales bacterium]|jgi:phospholipid/cholesterol/gamma-HCH transport system substrate-binding protein|nr:MlaD family protein [Bacteroidales bacterium]
MKLKQEIKTGVIVTVIIVLFIVGFNFLKGKNLLSSYNYYMVKYANVEGLQPSNPVSVNGFSVGLVTDIKFDSDRLDSLTVTIGVQKSLKLPVHSIAQINSGLMGDKSIALLLSTNSQIAENGYYLKGTIAPGLVDRLGKNVEDVAQKATNTLDSINLALHTFQQIFDANTQDNIHKIVANVEQLVASERRKISTILTNFESVSGNLKQNNEEISKLINNLSAFSSTLAASDVKTTIDNANKSLASLQTLLEGINNGEGTLGQLARNDSAYFYLQRSLSDLDKLLIDLREHPKDYVHFSLFGKKSEKKQ